MANKIFVFGSNLAGRHGKGAALHALQYEGAKYGQATGRQGNSYAIPTKDHFLKPLPLGDIQGHIDTFIVYAYDHRDEDFFVTRVGCGLAGYNDKEIAPMFEDVPDNCEMSPEWQHIIEAIHEQRL